MLKFFFFLHLLYSLIQIKLIWQIACFQNPGLQACLRLDPLGIAPAHSVLWLPPWLCFAFEHEPYQSELDPSLRGSVFHRSLFDMRMCHHAPLGVMCSHSDYTSRSPNPRLSIPIPVAISCPYSVPSGGPTCHLHFKSNAHKLKVARYWRLHICY